VVDDNINLLNSPPPPCTPLVLGIYSGPLLTPQSQQSSVPSPSHASPRRLSVLEELAADSDSDTDSLSSQQASAQTAIVSDSSHLCPTLSPIPSTTDNHPKVFKNTTPTRSPLQVSQIYPSLSPIPSSTTIQPIVFTNTTPTQPPLQDLQMFSPIPSTAVRENQFDERYSNNYSSPVLSPSPADPLPSKLTTVRYQKELLLSHPSPQAPNSLAFHFGLSKSPENVGNSSILVSSSSTFAPPAFHLSPSEISPPFNTERKIDDVSVSKVSEEIFDEKYSDFNQQRNYLETGFFLHIGFLFTHFFFRCIKLAIS